MGVRFIVISFNPAIKSVTQPPNGSSVNGNMIKRVVRSSFFRVLNLGIELNLTGVK
jgi:hypothetical protein